jgi:hypothetical protein
MAEERGLVRSGAAWEGGEDATFMRMKDKSLRAAYNVQIAVEGEYISGAGIFVNPWVKFNPYMWSRAPLRIPWLLSRLEDKL